MIHKFKSMSGIGPLVAVIAIFIAIFAWTDYKKESNAKAKAEKKEADAAACLASAECQDRIAQRKSRRSDDPIQSLDGQWFFKGNACSSDCEGHMAGYRWAERIGATKDAACDDASSLSFAEGCLAFIENNEPDTNYEPLHYPEDPEINGRFRD